MPVPPPDTPGPSSLDANPLELPNIGPNCHRKFRGEAPALLRAATFWTVGIGERGSFSGSVVLQVPGTVKASFIQSRFSWS
jgi:hypothetical protein